MSELFKGTVSLNAPVLFINITLMNTEVNLNLIIRICNFKYLERVSGVLRMKPRAVQKNESFLLERMWCVDKS